MTKKKKKKEMTKNGQFKTPIPLSPLPFPRHGYNKLMVQTEKRDKSDGKDATGDNKADC
jgi:hypothetical protein